jgi:hypothetical protein
MGALDARASFRAPDLSAFRLPPDHPPCSGIAGSPIEQDDFLVKLFEPPSMKKGWSANARSSPN